MPDVQVSLALRLEGKVSEVRSRGALALSPELGPPSEGVPPSPNTPPLTLLGFLVLRRKLVLDLSLRD